MARGLVLSGDKLPGIFVYGSSVATEEMEELGHEANTSVLGAILEDDALEEAFQKGVPVQVVRKEGTATGALSVLADKVVSLSTGWTW